MTLPPVDSRLTDEQLAELLALAETWFDHDGPTVNDLRILKAVRELQELRASATADGKRLEWAMRHIPGSVFSRLGVIYSDGVDRDAVDAAMTLEESNGR